MTEVELTISVGEAREPGPMRLVVTLVAAAVISALVLSSAFQITKPMIDANKARELRQGVLKVVPGSTALQPLVLRDGDLIPLLDEADASADVIYGAYGPDGQFMGYAIVGSAPGFQDTIRLLYGYDPARERVIGMHVLDSRETPGLGDNIYKDADFVANFNDLAVDPQIVVVKEAPSNDNEVDAITGATISSKAVVRIINTANAKWRPVLPEPGAEPPLEAPPAEEQEEDD